MSAVTRPSTGTAAQIKRRLFPLQVAVMLQGFLLWVPIEKLFMTEIGFTPVTVGVMAAAYAAVVPLVEFPSGILADRWSRRGVMIIGALSLAISSLVGGLSDNVITYIVAAMILGIYFAMNSGTVDAVVYDTLLEETGTNDGYERQIGRVRLLESGSFVVSAVIGGLVAEWTSTRVPYFVTIPAILLAIVAFLVFREPQLHRATEREPLRRHIAVTLSTMLRHRDVLAIGTLGAVAALVTTTVVEFGPLWLVAMAAPAALYGPYWAALMASFGGGGLLAGRVKLDSPVIAAVVAALAIMAGVLLTFSPLLPVVIIAQVLLALLMMIIGIHASRLLHDAVPSTIRAGVASGVGTLSWVVFLPFALILGWLARSQGVPRSGWMIVGATAVVGVLAVLAAIRHRAATIPTPDPPEVTCRDLVEQVTDYLESALETADRQRIEEHLAGCAGCSGYLHQLRTTVAVLRTLDRAEGTDSRTDT